MIHMPHRSVTRFFIPMIDVLLLLFCIFLLMPISSQEELDQSRAAAGDLSERSEVLERELQRRLKELQEYESLRPKLLEVQKLQQEIENLKNANKQPLNKRYLFQIIDIDGKTGDLYYYDPLLPAKQARVKIADESAAKKLIAKHQQESGERSVYYYFLYPRPQGGFPTRGQELTYQKWFADTPNSIQRAGP